MFGLQKWMWTAVIAAAAAAPAAAQNGGVSSGGRTTTGGGVSTSGGGGLSSSGLGSSSLGGGLGSSSLGGGLGSSSLGGGLGSSSLGGGLGSSSLGGGMGGSSLGGSSLGGSNSQQNMPTLQTSSSTLQKSNVFAGYYANPYAQGLSSGTSSTSASFGAPLFGTTNSSTGRGSLGGRGGSLGGLGGQNSSNQSGIVIPIQSQMNYTALMRFPTPPAAVGRIQSELRLTLDNTSMLANPKGVQILTDDGNNVTLRGTVRDEDEIRLVEGMVRLTPGVGAIKNELTLAPSTAGR